jgi:predicted nucleic acid-binding protein
MRIVIDTNCLLVSIPRLARHRWLFDALRLGTCEVVLTTEILNEYAEQLPTFTRLPFLKTYLNF